MKISCPACAAKYSIADEKVQDRLAKIRCRKCGTTIVIDGKVSPANVYAADGSAPAASGGAPQESAPAAGPAPVAGEYSVDFGDNDQRTMSVAQLVDAYNTGEVTPETFVWADGMADWAPLGEVAEIVDALHAAASGPSAADAGAAAAPAYDAGAAAPGFDASAAAPAYDAGAAAAPAYDAGAAAPGFDAGAAAAPAYDAGAAAPGFDAGAAAPAYDAGAAAPGFDAGAAAPAADAGAPAGASPWETEQAHARAAARPGGGRGSTADLFGSFDTAGSEEDVTTSAPQGQGAPAPAAAAATGARNESSVLFSLSALTASGTASSKPDATTATKEDSGLIDLKALTASAPAEEAGAADAGIGLGAPLMAAPLGGIAPLGSGVESQVAIPGSDGGGKSKTGLYIGGAIAFAALVIGGAVVLTSHGNQPAAPTPSAQPAVAATAAPKPSATEPAPTSSVTAQPPATGTAETTDAGPAKKPVKHVGGGHWHPPSHKTGGTSKPAAAKPKPKPKAHRSACGCAPGDLECAMRCAAK